MSANGMNATHDMNVSNGMNAIERKAAVSLAAVFGFRMIGLFMVMPVFAIYGQHLDGFSPIWIGIAIGAYGLTQALMQIPMGWLSDKLGRKPVIIGGLLVFALGSVVAGLSDHIYGVAFGRALQGAGAVASAVMALAADLSREEQRQKVMAVIGMAIGMSFTLALVLGPILAESVGLSGLFHLTAMLAVVGIGVVMLFIPTPQHKAPKGDVIASSAKLTDLLKHGQLLRLDVGIFVLHLVMTAIFVGLPLALVDAGLGSAKHWQLYVPALLGAFVLMVPAIIFASKKQKNIAFFQGALWVLMLALIVMAIFSDHIWGLALGVLLYFTGFNFLEASLPALISRIAPVGAKGTAMGIYSTSQFAGAFVGGVIGGALYSWLGIQGLFFSCALLVLFWWIYARGMQEPAKTKVMTLVVDTQRLATPDLEMRLLALQGVVEAAIVKDESVAYLRIKENDFNLSQAEALVRV